MPTPKTENMKDEKTDANPDLSALIAAWIKGQETIDPASLSHPATRTEGVDPWKLLNLRENAEAGWLEKTEILEIPGGNRCLLRVTVETPNGVSTTLSDILPTHRQALLNL
uniref:Uncharacterized protein n=1 Tax=Candidatus Kentrum sp. UNK TaxID=2126344 RepID=A0A451ARF5_9GAMM|nr:MAG: hypothetical protein BECKUNK1418G_GA0071005_100532 [Candidatus Kentron sp. UNK]VFK68610.1 MAG: hypothetical protein BECKUNK1418H_GA0071006_100432 [Candidatus Kentron sp. UNK]